MIKAKNIKAKNVVEGVQIQGGDEGAADRLIQLAKALETGDIEADSIEAKNIISGLQYIADPEDAKPEELKYEVGELRKNVESAIKAGEISNEGDAEDLQDALVKAEKELAAPQPKGSRIGRSLKTVTEILNQSAETLKAGGNLQAQVIKLAPTAALIGSIAKKLFGI